MAEGKVYFRYDEIPEKVNEARPFYDDNIDIDSENARHLIKLIVKYGNLEIQKVDVLSAPLYAKMADLNCLNVTKDLQSAAGVKFSNLFACALNGRNSLKAGSVFEIPVGLNSYSLDCKFVIFVALERWNGHQGSSVQDLKNGISNLLKNCSSKNAKSIALSALGTGIVFNFLPEEAATITGEKIKDFFLNHPNTSIEEIHLVIKQKLEYETVYIAYRETLAAMNLGDRIIVCNENGVPFPRKQIGDSIEKTIGNLSVTVVYGDIVNESTCAIVNSTNFKRWTKGSVAHAVFLEAGDQIAKDAVEGKKNGKDKRKIVMTGPGNLQSKWILHCNCEGRVDNIKTLMDNMFYLCDETGLSSLSIPAIGTGTARLSPKSVAETMMNSVSALSTNNGSVSVVRLITHTPYIYHIFCSELRKQV